MHFSQGHVCFSADLSASDLHESPQVHLELFFVIVTVGPPDLNGGRRDLQNFA